MITLYVKDVKYTKTNLNSSLAQAFFFTVSDLFLVRGLVAHSVDDDFLLRTRLPINERH